MSHYFTPNHMMILEIRLGEELQKRLKNYLAREAPFEWTAADDDSAMRHLLRLGLDQVEARERIDE